MHPEVTLRAVEPADNERLIALIRGNPMEGSLALSADWSPAAFAFARLQAERTRMMVAQAQDRLVGLIQIGESTALWRGAPIRLVHAGDLRIDPSARRGKTVRALLDQARDLMEQDPDAIGVTEMLAGNAAAFALNRYARERLQVVDAGCIRVLQVLPVMIARPRDAWTYRTATPADLFEIAELLHEHYAQHELRPDISTEWLERQLSQHASFDASNLHLACKQGRICAVVGLWDQESLRRIVVDRYSASARALTWALDGTRWLTGLPRTPDPGQVLRTVYARWPAHRPGMQGALRDLLRQVMKTTVKGAGYHCLLLGLHEADASPAALRSLLCLEQRFHVFLYAARGGRAGLEANVLGGKPLFTDLSLL